MTLPLKIINERKKYTKQKKSEKGEKLKGTLKAAKDTGKKEIIVYK